MATVTVLKFPGADAAAEALAAIRDLRRRRLITLHDAAIVSWPRGRTRPSTRQLTALAGKEDGGGMWGRLAGLLRGQSADGLDDRFIRHIGLQVTEGTSALFLMTSGAVLDKVTTAMRGATFEILATNLTKEQERTLRDVLSVR